MKPTSSPVVATVLAVLGLLGPAGPAAAQVAGATTTVDTGVVESTQIALGWSAKKSLLGKTLYNDAGQKVGRVQDLIVSPDQRVSYLIVGAGGFVGIDRHDVAVPVAQIQEQAGKLVMAGATKDTIQGLPEFTYATDTTRRDQFVAAADNDIAQGKAAVLSLQRKAGTAGADAKAQIDVDVADLQSDLKSAERKVSELKQASAARWKSFEADVSAATARLRKSTVKALG